MNIFAAMKPDAVYGSVYDIPLDKLREEGKKCLLLDFDNTLGPDHATKPDNYAFDFIKKVKDSGFICCLVSNAKTGRSAGIAEALGIPCVTYAHKPRPDGIYRALKLMNTEASEAVMVGDRIDNDIIPAKKMGMKTIWVRQGNGRFWKIGSDEEKADLVADALSEIVDML